MNNELVIVSDPKSVISEDIRTIKTNIEFSSVDNKIKLIMVTSSVPKEGKSFISSNLAVAFANNYKKVLLIDCDMRLGRLHKVFNLTNKHGLFNLILNMNKREEREKYIKSTSIENLFVIPRGPVPANPSELLSSKRFEKLLEELKDDYDLIILDSAPVNGLSDSLIISKLVDKVVVVSRYGYTQVEDLKNTKRLLDKAGADVAGVIINRAPYSRKKYGGYYTTD